MTQAEIYRLLDMDIGDHFLYRNTECIIDSRPVLLVYDYMFGDWLAPRYETMQVSYLAQHANEATPLPVEKWHLRYGENSKKITAYKKGKRYAAIQPE